MTRPLLVICCSLLTSHLTAQSIAVQGRVAFPLSSSQVVNGSGNTLIDRGAGVWGGVAVDARVSWFSASVTGLRGGLGASDGRFPERDGGEVSALVRYEPRSTFALEMRHTTRVFSSAAGRQRWTLWGLGGVGFLNLGSPLVRASGGFTYMPVVRVTDETFALSGVAAEVALSATPRRIPLMLTATYRIEKISFPATSQRAEQFEAFTLAIGLQVQRRNGRWGRGRGAER